MPRHGRNFSNERSRIDYRGEKSLRHDTESNDYSQVSRNAYQTPVKNHKKAPKVFLIQPEEPAQQNTKKPAVPRFSHPKVVRDNSKEKENEKEKKKEKSQEPKKPIDPTKGKIWSVSKPEIPRNLALQKGSLSKEGIENSSNIKTKSKRIIFL